MEFPPEGYRRGVGICLFNSSGKIFAASRLNGHEIWEMPQESTVSLLFFKYFSRFILCELGHISIGSISDFLVRIYQNSLLSSLFEAIRGSAEMRRGFSSNLYPFLSNLLFEHSIGGILALVLWVLGGVNEGEDLKTAAKRELMEETGVVSAEIIAESASDTSNTGEQDTKARPISASKNRSTYMDYIISPSSFHVHLINRKAHGQVSPEVYWKRRRDKSSRRWNRKARVWGVVMDVN
uniref:Nudix hydrolase domain-containing protein n=1 Tax=Cucumis melo TaxID=3656 RepID=A0A9I9CW96_CUCME